jgi:hypothetical protein
VNAGTTILNGKRATGKALRQMARALADRKLLGERGGFLLKATLKDEGAWLSVVPCILNGARTYHYDMKLAEETAYTLIGAVNANGVFTLFFQPGPAGLGEDARGEYLKAYSRLAALLFDNGYDGEARLDWSTRRLLEESEVARPAPESLAALIHPTGP